MIIYETVTIDDVQYEHVYSDAGKYLVRDGKQWEEIYNPLNTGRVYTEGEPIPETEATADEILGILLGGGDD